MHLVCRREIFRPRWSIAFIYVWGCFSWVGVLEGIGLTVVHAQHPTHYIKAFPCCMLVITPLYSNTCMPPYMLLNNTNSNPGFCTAVWRNVIVTSRCWWCHGSDRYDPAFMTGILVLMVGVLWLIISVKAQVTGFSPELLMTINPPLLLLYSNLYGIIVSWKWQISWGPL